MCNFIIKKRWWCDVGNDTDVTTDAASFTQDVKLVGKSTYNIKQLCAAKHSTYVFK